MILEGNVSVKAAVLGGMREVYEIIVDQNKHDKDTAFILRQAEQRNIKITRADRETIDSMASGRTHGGLIAAAGARKYQSTEEVIDLKDPFFALVEGVEDPFNLGYVIRSL